MVFRIFCLLIFFAASIISSSSFAQEEWQSIPEITLRGDDDLGAFAQKGLILETLEISVDVRAGLAQVSLGATLRNETDDEAEATFAYPLPKGAVINGYALDLDGELVDGVLMPKERAEKLYTDRVTQSIDPGIAARTSDNRYKTRIYPIDAEGGRRSVRLDFAAPVPAEGLRLPLASKNPIETVSIRLSGDGADLATTPLSDARDSMAENIVLSGDIFIPAAAAEPSLSAHNGQTLITVPLSQPAAKTPTPVSSIAVIWDNSLSRSADDVAAERRFVSAVLEALSPKTQSLIAGGQNIESAARFAAPDALTKAIGSLTYDGATNLSQLLDIKTINRRDIRADICLVISDGKSSLGAASLPSLPCRVFTFSAAENPNLDWLSLLASENNGADLSGLGPREAARVMSQDGGLQRAPGQAGAIFTFGNRQWFIAPVDADARNYTLSLKGGRKRINLRGISKTPHLAAGSFWGQREMARLRADGAKNFDAVVKASRHWGVQGKETSFLVLESAWDYIEAKIDPPTSFPADRLEDYKTDLAEAQEEAADDRADHLEEIAEDWKEQIEWWETDWINPDDFYDDDDNSDLPQPIVPAPPPPSALPQPAPPQSAPPMTEEEQDLSDAGSETVVVTASRIANDYTDEIIVSGVRRGNPAGELPAEISVEIRPWTPDRPFLKALASLDGAAFETEYLQQRETHGDRPTFYLEVADQLHRQGRIQRAARMAATALDLPTVTTITQSNVADRLLMYGETDTAIMLYRDILPTAQDRPQPFYNLALALIRAGDRKRGKTRDALYAEAFEHLVHVINEPWEEDYDGIHLIALQDLNRTLARLSRWKRRRMIKSLDLDDGFIRNLPVDIRVLVDWTGDDADLDIHVLERVGHSDEEEAYYGNNATDIGGRISNDMTEGYGPEEYMIRKAPDGLYRVETDYYAQDDYAEDGAIKLRARIWRNFGRKSETLETVIIEMLEEKEDPYVLGEIQVGVAAARETE
jgi:tetratricopeptide (TPR) repeat protein